MSKGSILGWRHENHPVTAPDVFILNVCFTAVKIQNGFFDDRNLNPGEKIGHPMEEVFQYWDLICNAS